MERQDQHLPSSGLMDLTRTCQKCRACLQFLLGSDGEVFLLAGPDRTGHPFTSACHPSYLRNILSTRKRQPNLSTPFHTIHPSSTLSSGGTQHHPARSVHGPARLGVNNCGAAPSSPLQQPVATPKPTAQSRREGVCRASIRHPVPLTVRHIREDTQQGWLCRAHNMYGFPPTASMTGWTRGVLLTFCSWPDATPRIALTGPGVELGERRGEGDWWWPLGSVFDASMRGGGGRRETRLGWYRAWEGVGLGGGGPMENRPWMGSSTGGWIGSVGRRQTGCCDI